MRIAIDAMGGDYAPQEIVHGALGALNDQQDLELILVGQEEAIKEHFAKKYTEEKLTIQHCTEFIAMEETTMVAYRKKKDASITVTTRLVKEGHAQAVISAGNTGAQMVA